MKTRNVAALGTLVWILALAACGDDGGDDAEPVDAGPDASEEGGSGGSGRGGSGGKGGSGGQPTGGRGGRGGGGGAAGEDEQGGSGGTTEAGSGGRGGSGGAGSGGTGGSGPAPTYSIGGSVSGLSGTGLVLKNNGGNDLTVSNSGDFTFGDKLQSGAQYAVTVGTQPSNPSQTCSVAAGSGTVGSANVTNVNVTCSTTTQTIGGSVAGLGGGSIILKNNGGDALTLSAEGSFVFATAIASGAAYAVTVDTPPAGRTCSVDQGSGNVGSSNVTNVAVACYANVAVVAQPRAGGVSLTWNNNGATSYAARVSSDANCNFDSVSGCAGGAEQNNVTSPYLWTGLTNGKVYYFQVRGAHPANFTTKSEKVGVRPSRAQFDAPVLATAVGANGTVYAGGSFSYIGAYTGTAVPIDINTGVASAIPDFPQIAGQVHAIISDGSTGYFIGGDFTTVGGITRNNLAHVLANGTVDPNWNPDLDGTVVALALGPAPNNTLYVAGTFTNVNVAAASAARAGLAGFQTTGTGMVTGWNPAPSGGAVNTIVVSADTVYIGGEFTMIGSEARNRLAAFSESTGVLSTTWNPGASGNVEKLLLSGTRMYVAGYFQMLSNTARFGLGAVDATSGAIVSGFAPEPNMGVTSIALSGSTLFAGGIFTSIGGQNRDYLAAVNADTGVADVGWNPAPDNDVSALLYVGDTLYVGGQFAMIGGAARSGLAALSPTTGMATSWNPRPNGEIMALANKDNTLYIGGQFTTLAPELRGKLASFSNGSLTNWNPDAKNGDVLALAFSSGTVYAGGTFDMIGTTPTGRQAVAAIDGAGAVVTGWNAQVSNNGEVHAIVAGNNRVYIGGAFSEAGGDSKSNIAALNTTNGNEDATWQPSGTDGRVRALALGGTTLYLGGEFLNALGSGRERLAAIDTAGALESWNPGASATVLALAVSNSNVYVGGEFMTLGGTARNYLGAVGVNGTLDAWDPNLDGQVNAFSLTGDILYVGGQFSQIGGVTGMGRLAIASFDTTNNTLTFWAKNVSGDVFAVSSDDTNVYIGGDFFRVAGVDASNLYREAP